MSENLCLSLCLQTDETASASRRATTLSIFFDFRGLHKQKSELLSHKQPKVRQVHRTQTTETGDIMAASMKHDRTRRPQSEEEEDPVETMIKKTGCIQLHYAVQVRTSFLLLKLSFH